MNELNDLVTSLLPILARYPQIVAAWVFGPAARGELRSHDHIDIGILLRDPRVTGIDEFMLLCDLTARLEVITTPRQPAVVLLEREDPLAAHNALTNGTLILEPDRARRIAFEAETAMRAIALLPARQVAERNQLQELRTWVQQQLR